jgi:serine protease AprX
MEKNKMRILGMIFTAFLILLNMSANAQKEAQKYFISFKDKPKDVFSVGQPEKFLSPRSLERRKKQNIGISERDLPVNDGYLGQVRKAGAKIDHVSKWLNGVLIECSPEILVQIQKLSFVNQNYTIAKPKAPKETRSEKRMKLEFQKKTTDEQQVQGSNNRLPLEISKPEDYGKAFTQAQQLGVEKMHEQGYRGQGMIIAIFDAGFNDADKQDYFKHLFDNQQILGIYDFVANEPSVFEDDSHGRMVLSCIAAYQTGKMIGTAPEASFYLFRTEDASTEYKIEEYNWLRAAEVADSLGVDIINSSLGYNNFDDGKNSYKLSDMDGKTSVVAQAAEFASAVGMVVVSSAGNEGGSSWGKITTPADAESVLSVGAIGNSGDIAYFSSRGNTSDNRIKPDLVAHGQNTTVGGSGSVTTSNGTSFASPVLTGLVAGFWQANPQLSAKQVKQYLKKSANQAQNPNSDYGFGLPNFSKAQALVKADQTPNLDAKNAVKDSIKAISNNEIQFKNNNDFILSPSSIKKNENIVPVLYWGTNYVGKDVVIKVLKEKDAKNNKKKKVKTITTVKAFKINKDTVLEMLQNLSKGNYVLEVTPMLGDKKSVNLVIE